MAWYPVSHPLPARLPCSQRLELAGGDVLVDGRASSRRHARVAGGDGECCARAQHRLQLLAGHHGRGNRCRHSVRTMGVTCIVLFVCHSSLCLLISSFFFPIAANVALLSTQLCHLFKRKLSHLLAVALSHCCTSLRRRAELLFSQTITCFPRDAAPLTRP
jgi:hypothetical protein